MIQIKGTRDYLVSLESVAMTDIVLNMFIFFFISFSLLYTFSPEKVSKIEVNLPSASSAVSLDGAGSVLIAVTQGGAIYIGDTAVDPNRLKARLTGMLKDNPGMRVVLRVDAQAAFDGVMKVLDVVNALKIKKVSVAAIKKLDTK